VNIKSCFSGFGIRFTVRGKLIDIFCQFPAQVFLSRILA